jgi:hypothetical protein
MPRPKKTSRVLEKAELRAAGMKGIDPELSFGDTYKLSDLTTIIEELRAKIESYNTALAVIDSSQTEIASLEKELGDVAEKMLIGVAFRYGKDSREYEMAGGVRKSDRVRRSVNSRLKAKTDSQTDDSSDGKSAVV